MHGLPLVSIVMPSLNQAKFINASIDSVLEQDYSQLELIVADGGSIDETLEVLRNKSELDSRLRWFSRKDSGPAEAINNALTEARGTIIGWLNSDDLYTPGAISRAIQAFDTHSQWTMVYGHGEYVDEMGELLYVYPTLPPTTPVERFSDGCFICQPTVFFKKSMNLLLGKLDENLKTAFDFDYWLRAFVAFSGRIGFVDAIQAKSRLHSDCITRNMRECVAVEGVRVIARHLGKAPSHWLTTYFEEMLSQSALETNKDELRRHFIATVEKVETDLTPTDISRLRETFQNIFCESSELHRVVFEEK